MKRFAQLIFSFTLDFQGYCADVSETAETMDDTQAAEKKTEAMSTALINCCRSSKNPLKWVKPTKFSEKLNIVDDDWATILRRKSATEKSR